MVSLICNIKKATIKLRGINILEKCGDPDSIR